MRGSTVFFSNSAVCPILLKHDYLHYILLWYKNRFDIFILQICLNAKQSNLLKSIGLEVKPFRLHWYTTWFNRIIQKWGSTRPKLLLAWFSTGSLVAITLVPLAVGLLVRSMYLNLRELINEEYSLTTIGTFQPMVIGTFVVVCLCLLFRVSILVLC